MAGLVFEPLKALLQLLGAHGWHQPSIIVDTAFEWGNVEGAGESGVEESEEQRKNSQALRMEDRGGRMGNRYLRSSILDGRFFHEHAPRAR